MNGKAQREVLRRSSTFLSLSDQECDALLACLSVRSLAPGTVVFRQGDPGTTMILVAEGSLVATTRRSDGVEVEINRMGVGEIIGEMTFLDPAPRSVTVIARTACMVYELSEDGMSMLRMHSPGAASALVSAIIREVTRRLRRIDQLIEEELRLRDARPAAGGSDGG